MHSFPGEWAQGGLGWLGWLEVEALRSAGREDVGRIPLSCCLSARPQRSSKDRSIDLRGLAIQPAALVIFPVRRVVSG